MQKAEERTQLINEQTKKENQKVLKIAESQETVKFLSICKVLL